MKESKKDRLEDLKYDDQGLIPTIIQDYQSNEVLMLAYMNKDSLKKTIEDKKTCFWSRSRKKYWIKGETSGNFQEVKDISYDCDKDTLLIKVKQNGVACHTGEYSCFFTNINGQHLEKKTQEENIINEVYEVIENRKKNPSPESYVSSLIKKGEDKVLEKIIEEAGEVIIDVKNKNKERIIMEVADLWFHTLIMLSINNITTRDIYAELRKRRKK
ncbi:MAG: bifunctional phosphoribosyl-AMP cyclohydrolase/phosphoribosyl-ATP diphosphatase HisIE [bacterium]|nr:bifunctional phosphoribosyl-AMP cyclohydrolase/phosphoribosyl-ATP diphosphatase HisIE [bacterium]